MLPVAGHYFGGNVLDQFIGVHYAVFVLIGRALQAFQDEITEHAVAAAELGTFDGDFFGTAGQQAEEVASTSPRRCTSALTAVL